MLRNPGERSSRLLLLAALLFFCHLVQQVAASDEDDKEELYRGLVIGSVMGIPALIILLFIVVVCCCRRKKKIIKDEAPLLKQVVTHDSMTAEHIKSIANRVSRRVEANKAAEAALALPPTPPDVVQEEIIEPLERQRLLTFFVPTLTATFMEIDKSKVELLEEIGSGSFSQVFKAKLVLGDDYERIVAVKVAKTDGDNFADNCRALEKELDALASIGQPHENVVQLVGAVTRLPDCFYLVTELYEGGNLLEFLRRQREVGVEVVDDAFTEPPQQQEQRLTRGDLLRIASQIAKGMKFLHETMCLHIDLTARHVLLASDRTPKIGGFGLHRKSNFPNEFIKIPPQPWRWSAPEVLSQTNPYFHEGADVWSFGVVLWEIFSLGEEPYAEFKEQPDTFYGELKHYNKRLAQPDLASPEIYAIMSACWNEISFDRPKFEQLGQQLDALQDGR